MMLIDDVAGDAAMSGNRRREAMSVPKNLLLE